MATQYYDLQMRGSEVQEALEAALSAYQKPGEGIPLSDFTAAIREAISTIADKYVKPDGGIPATDLESAVRTALASIASKYVKPTNGIPASDLAAGVIPDVSGFVTRSVNDLLNYYLKADTYTKTEVQALVNTVKQFQYEVVSELPTASESTMHKIYLVPSTNPKTKNTKDEYITIESSGAYSWEQIGTTTIDLTNYVTNQALQTALADYATTAALTLALAGKMDKVPAATEGNIAVLNSDGNVADGNKKLSDLASIVKGYLYNGVFYEESAHTTEITPAENNQYLDMTDASTPKAYIWNGSAYIAYAGAENAVKYTQQTLTEQQQTQARQNIGAAHDESVVAKEGDEMAALAIIINQQNARILALENALRFGLKTLVVDNLEVRNKFNQFVSEGNSYLRGAGAPSADVIPDGWSEDEYGPWTGVPQYIGQRYLNTSTNKWYTAKGNSSVSDWVQDTNA